jgi:glycosyltransferase involved in cell wall biosynthesis
MLRGREGGQRQAVEQMVDWLADALQPDALIFSNLLIGGCIPAIRQRSSLAAARVVVTLQGDDIFLEHLREPHRSEAIARMSQIAEQVDAFLVHSRFYAEKMGALLSIPAEKFVVIPLAIDLAALAAAPEVEPAVERGADALTPEGVEAPEGARANVRSAESQEASPRGATARPLRIGYFARLAPEKGLHQLVDAFIALAQRPGTERCELHIAGWQGPQHQEYVEELVARLEAAGLSERITFHGSPDLAGKRRFLESLDLLSVPTVYQEPKGLFVLEAWAVGVPVLQPHHGAFPELLEAGGGRLFPADDPAAFIAALEALVRDEAARRQLGEEGRRRVHQRHTLEAHADALLHLLAGESRAMPREISGEQVG